VGNLSRVGGGGDGFLGALKVFLGYGVERDGDEHWRFLRQFSW
jgi:hypothetical protein